MRYFVRGVLMCAIIFTLSWNCMANNQDDFLDAANAGDVKEVERLLKSGVNINAQAGESKTTALMLAAFSGHMEVVKLLVAKGAKLDLKNSIGCTALVQASQSGHTEVVAFLADKGADINNGGFLGMSPLIFAAGKGDIAIVKVLVEKGANVNKKMLNGRTALIIASGGNELHTLYPEIVKFLIDNGADVNIKDDKKKTALMYAKEVKNAELIKILETAGKKK